MLILPPGEARIEVNYPDPAISRKAQGIYTYDLDCTIPNLWKYGTRATGTGKTAGEAELFVRPSDLLAP